MNPKSRSSITTLQVNSLKCGGKDSSNLWHGLAVEEMLVDEMWGGKDSSNLWHGLVVEEMLVDEMWGGGERQ